MGGCLTKNSKPYKADEAQIIETSVEDGGNNQHMKVILLGAGECGKSTVVKQLKSIYKIELTDEDLTYYKTTIHQNTLESIQTFIENAEKFGFSWENEKEKEAAERIKGFSLDRLLSKEIAKDIADIWQTKAIQDTFKRRHEFWNLDASVYYFENVLRFAEDSYTPTEDDRIMTRVRTTGIVTTEFEENGVRFEVVDVAGQKSERRKWMHCFKNVKAIVFVVSLAGYNQVMFEDSTNNRMLEELNLFQQIANNLLFVDVPIYLLLNKKDLFESMIAETDLGKCFPEFKAGNNLHEAMRFVQLQFEKKLESNQNRLKVNFIAARYKKDIKYTWEEITENLITFYNLPSKKKKVKS